MPSAHTVGPDQFIPPHWPYLVCASTGSGAGVVMTSTDSDVLVEARTVTYSVSVTSSVSTSVAHCVTITVSGASVVSGTRRVAAGVVDLGVVVAVEKVVDWPVTVIWKVKDVAERLELVLLVLVDWADVMLTRLRMESEMTLSSGIDFILI
jgi:hypothetical protein